MYPAVSYLSVWWLPCGTWEQQSFLGLLLLKFLRLWRLPCQASGRWLLNAQIKTNQRRAHQETNSSLSKRLHTETSLEIQSMIKRTKVARIIGTEWSSEVKQASYLKSRKMSWVVQENFSCLVNIQEGNLTLRQFIPWQHAPYNWPPRQLVRYTFYIQATRPLDNSSPGYLLDLT